MRAQVEQAEREQQLRVAQGQAAERQRIAREMHDVLAHRISLVSMYSGALAYRDDLSPEQTREIAETIRENANLALTELRGVLGSLRGEDGDRPQPTLADLPGLIDDNRAAGLRIEFSGVTLKGLSPAVGATPTGSCRRGSPMPASTRREPRSRCGSAATPIPACGSSCATR